MGLPLSTGSGSAMLDREPPSPNDKVYPSTSKPGQDTTSLLGEPVADETGAGGALATPANRLILACSMFMNATNIAESAQAGIVPDPVKQWIAQFMEQAPLIAEQMSRQGDPLAMLAAAGQSVPGSAGGPGGPAGAGAGMGAGPGAGMGGAPTGAPPMGMAAMGLAGGAGGGSPMMKRPGQPGQPPMQ